MKNGNLIPDNKTDGLGPNGEAPGSSEGNIPSTEKEIPDENLVSRKSSTGNGSYFRLSERGVEKRHEEKEGEAEWRWFCSRLKIAAETRNAEGEDWGRLLIVRDRDGLDHHWPMPMELLAGDGAEYRQRLLSLGLVLAPGPKAKTALHEYITTWRPKERIRCVSRIGWHGQTFVLPDRSFCSPGDEPVIYQSPMSNSHAFHTLGSLDTWQHEIGQYCAGNSRLVLAVSAAFAAPLLHLAGLDGGGINIVGQSQTGKTTALRVAGSVWGGGGNKGFIETWRATSNGLEGVAAMHNDVLLCLDEMGQVDSWEVGAVAYMLANGEGKIRARRDGSAKPSAQWRLLFLSSGETGLADKMLERGLTPKAGQEVRLADLPADSGAGMGLFEKLHGFDTPGALASHLREATRSIYGVPSREFLERLREMDQLELADRITTNCQCFVKRHVGPEAPGQVQSVAARFGLIGVAGELAIEMGILPWAKGEALHAAALCLGAWRQNRGGLGVSEIETGIVAVRQFLEIHEDSRFEWLMRDSDRLGRRPPYSRAGWCKETERGEFEFFILPSIFETEICKGFDHRTVAGAMAERGLLQPSPDGRMKRKERVGGADTRWVYRVLPAIFDYQSEVPYDELVGDTGDTGDNHEKRQISKDIQRK